MFSDKFVIPNLPSGQKLHFNILSTWGDMNYVGLAGIEIFDSEGRPVKVENISACPPDVNILPGYGGDPRTVEKLIDGHYFTNDDLNVWLTPFTAGEDHTITIDLGKRYQISMIRIWNYNKSRIHSYRGARLLTCELDTKMIFRGEIQKAAGTVNDPEKCCEIVLFTENEAILQKVDAQDWLNEKVVSMENTQKLMQDIPACEERPMTATKKFNTAEMAELEDFQRQLKQHQPTSLFDERPQTSAIITGEVAKQVHTEKKQAVAKSGKAIAGRVVEINIVETWGDLFYVGLTGIEIVDDHAQLIPINMNGVSANPRDMNTIQGGNTDYRTLDKLFDRENNTQDDHHMWLIPFNKGESHTITIDLGK